MLLLKYVCLKIPFQKIFPVACYDIKYRSSDLPLDQGEILKLCVTSGRFTEPELLSGNAIPFDQDVWCGQGIWGVFKNSCFGLPHALPVDEL